MPGRKEAKLIDWFVEINRSLGWQVPSGFIPSGTDLAIRESVSELVHTIFSGDETVIRQCLSFVQANFVDIFIQLRPVAPLSPVIFYPRLPRFVRELADRLMANGCRSKFAVTAQGHSFQTIPFPSMSILWNRDHDEIRNYGLAYYYDNDRDRQVDFIFREYAEDWRGNPRRSTIVNFQEMDDQDSRLFIFGLIVDLMQMGKMLIDDSNFVKQATISI